MKIVIMILAIGLIILPQMVNSQQRTLLHVNKSPSDTLKQNLTRPLPRPALSKYDYYHNLGIACKAELKLEKATKIPFRFRLGSLQQTDYLEGKPHAQKPENR